MNKTIDTLVQDIYGLFSSDFSPTEGAAQSFGQRLANHLITRIGERRAEEKGNLRLSSIGTPCERKLWYSVNTPNKAEQLSPQVRMKFLFGDILEELLLFLAEQAGHEVIGQQDEVEVNGVKGHRDAIIDGRIVDVKSATSLSFDKFAYHGLQANDPFGYLTQLGTYLYGSKGDPGLRDNQTASFLAVDKQHGKICLDTYPLGDIQYDVMVEHKKSIVNQEKPPPRPYQAVPDGRSGNMKLDTVCSYCQFKFTCWKELRTFIYSSGPRYLTKVERLPDVQEVTFKGE